MPDDSDLDNKYFVTGDKFNCAFCKRRHVSYTVQGCFPFDWTNDKVCYFYPVRCESCKKTSMHLSYTNLLPTTNQIHFRYDVDLDGLIFYSVPTSFFVLDSRINKVLRDLITEAEGCLKMNFLTGASACTRKAIYELAVLEKAEGENYDERIKYLKEKYPQVDTTLFDVLAHIKDMTSDKVHEQSWDKWNSPHLVLFIETLKTILQEIYIIPEERGKRTQQIKQLLEGVRNKQNEGR